MPALEGLELDLVVYGTEAPAGLLECIELAERAGLAGVWVGDSQLLWRELYVVLGAAAARTRTVRLGPGVTNPVTRDTSVTASALATLQELAHGRAALGMGLGDSAVRTVGAEPARLTELETAVEKIRAYWADGEGMGSRAGPTPIPVYVGASGPRMLELAGRIGDGCLAVVGLQRRQLEAARERIARGLEAAGRARDEFDTIFWVPFALSEEPAVARDAVKAYVARSLQHPLPAPLSEREQAVADAIRRAYAYSEHLAPGAAHARLVPDEIVEDWAVAGRPEECREQLERLARRDVEHAALLPLGREPKPRIVRRLLEEVIAG